MYDNFYAPLGPPRRRLPDLFLQWYVLENPAKRLIPYYTANPPVAHNMTER